MNLKDIAKLAGVSASTVSKIINKKDESISQETRERVLKIVNEYNYTPYSASRKFPSTTGIIGILISSSAQLNNTLNGILKEAQNMGYSPLILNSYEDEDQELKNMTRLANKQVDGILYSPVASKNSRNQDYLSSLEIPIVLLTGENENLDFLHPAEQAAYFMTNQLIRMQHRNIACVVNPKNNNDAFINGYKQALYDNGLSLDASTVLTNITDKINNSIINRELTAFITPQLIEAVNLNNTALQNGLLTPKDYSLISILDESESEFSSFKDKISTVTLSYFDFGKYLCRKLISLITNVETEKFDTLHLQLDSTKTITLPDKDTQSKIIIVGSINMDTYLYSDVLPYSGGATILSDSTKSPGGKGFNQALGVARLGEKVNLIGNLGLDMDSNIIFQELEKNNINTSHLTRSENQNTGQAYIFVETSGDSTISILPGANTELTPKKVIDKKELFSDAELCLIQTEIPLETVEKVVSIAYYKNIPIVLKPSASKIIPDKILEKIDYLIPNESELSNLSPNLGSIEEKTEFLLAKGIKNIIVTLGENGSFLKTEKLEKYYPALDSIAVDATGASDAYISAFASYLINGYSLDSSIQVATIAAGLSVSRDGIVDSLVSRDILENYISKRNPNLLLNIS